MEPRHPHDLTALEVAVELRRAEAVLASLEAPLDAASQGRVANAIRGLFATVTCWPRAKLDESGHEFLIAIANRAFAALDAQLARDILRYAVRIGRRLYPREHAARVDGIAKLAVVLKDTGNVRRAATIERASLGRMQRNVAPDDPIFCRTLVNHALTCYSLGSIEAALEHTEAAFRAIAVSNLPQPDAGWIVATHGSMLSFGGQLVRAERMLRMGIGLLGNDAPDALAQARINARMNLAIVVKRQGRFAESDALMTQVLDAARRTFPEDHPSRGVVESLVARQLQDKGDFAAAEAIYRRLLEVAIEHGGRAHSEAIRLASNVGASLVLQRRFKEAVAWIETWCGIADQTLEPAHSLRIATRSTYALALHGVGDLDAAAMEITKQITAQEAAQPAAVMDILELRAILASIEVARGNGVIALAILDDVLPALERTHDANSPHLDSVLKTVVAARYGLGDVAGARLACERRLALLRTRLPPDHPDVFEAITDLALLLKEYGQLELALKVEQEAEAALALCLPNDDVRLASARLNIAWSFLRGDRFDDATHTFRQVADAVGPRHRLALLARAGLASTALFAGTADYGEAEARGVVDDLIQRGMTSDPLLAVMRRTLLLAHARRGDRAGALREAHNAFREALARLETAARGSSVREAEAAATFEAPLFNGLCSLALGLSPVGRMAELVDLVICIAEASRLVVLAVLDRLRQDRSGAEHATEPWRPAGVLPEEDGAAVVQAALERDAADRSRSAWQRESFLSALDPGALANSLAQDEAIIAFCLPTLVALQSSMPAKEHAVAIVLTTGKRWMLDLGESAHIEALADEWLESIRCDSLPDAVPSPLSGVGDLEFRAGTALRLGLLDAVLADLPGVGRLSIIADGVIEHLPLDALPEDDHVLGDRLDIRFIPWLSRRPRPTAPSAGLLYVGNVDHGAPRDGGRVRFPDLAATAQEVDLVAAAHRSALPDAPIVRLGERDVTARRMLASMRGHRFIHLATHGFVELPRSARPLADARPMLQADSRSLRATFSPLDLCGLALTDANRDPDGLLPARSIAYTDLSGTELVVLSACSTRRGWSRRLLGAASLARAFHSAGAQAVIAAIDYVADARTRELMAGHLYPAMLSDAADPITALAQAKRALRKGGARTRDWAFFVASVAPPAPAADMER